MDFTLAQTEALRNLTAELPLNDMGLPLGVYRTDMLPYHEYELPGAPGSQGSQGSQELLPAATNGEHKHRTPRIGYDRIAGFPKKALSAAFVHLYYDDGYPSFLNGQPFWAQMDYEPMEAYNAFQRYTQMPRGRPAAPYNDEYAFEDEEQDYGESAGGTRSVADLASILAPKDADLLQVHETLQTYYHLYYWAYRVAAYDMYRVVQHRKQQELRAIETQDEHYVDSRRLRSRLMAYLGDEAEFWEMMTPKIGVDMLKTLVQLERVSAGMPAMGPMPAGREGSDERHPSFEVAFRNIARANNPASAEGEVSEDHKRGVEVLAQALNDPESTEYLQELIVRVNGG